MDNGAFHGKSTAQANFPSRLLQKLGIATIDRHSADHIG
jgi:hypothetical protein